VQCIFCLEEREPSKEDIFPLALGGGIITNRVCAKCNSLLGTEVDAALCNYPGIVAKRSELRLAGQSGRVPDAFVHLLGAGGVLASDPTHKVSVRLNRKTGQPEIKLLPKKTVLPDGGLQMAMEPAQAKRKLPIIIQRHRKRSGLPPLTPEELALQAEKAWSEGRLENIENPSVIHKIPVDFRSARRGIFKIAYELAAMWLGDEYVVGDPMANLLRDVILGRKEEQDAGLRGTIEFSSGVISVLAPWAHEKNCHVALYSPAADTIAVALKIFDVVEAVIAVSVGTLGKYAAGPLDPERFRFVYINPATGEIRESSLPEAFGRAWLAQEAVSSN
jgi:hypothetical protein